MRVVPRPAYWSIALAAMQRGLAYRTTALLRLVSDLVWVAVLFYLWQTVFAQQAELGGLSWAQMRTYILVSFAVNALLGFSSAARLMGTIKTGEVATELLRPVDFLLAQFAQAAGAAVVEGLLSGALALVLGVLVLGVAPPASLLAAVMFLVSVALGFCVKFLVTYLVALVCFWTVNSLGLLWAQNALVSVFSGALIPLQFMPGWLRTVALAAPFQAIVYTPVQIYLGALSGTALWWAIAIQAAWVVALWVAARLLWRPAARALEIQGG
jgi:ABC-2 type transport system permease protein